MTKKCNKCENLCFVKEIENHLSSYPTQLFESSEGNGRRVLKLMEVTVRSSQVEEQISNILYNALIELKYLPTKFSPEAFSIIDEKFSLWQLWYKEITLLHKYFVSHDITCSYYPQVIIELANRVTSVYEKRFSKIKLGKNFLITHKYIYDEFIRGFSHLTFTDIVENVFYIGKLLVNGLEATISEVITHDSFLRNEDTIYIYPRVIRFDVNLIRIFYEIYRKPFTVKYFGFDPIVEEKVLYWIKEANLQEYYRR